MLTSSLPGDFPGGKSGGPGDAGPFPEAQRCGVFGRAQHALGAGSWGRGRSGRDTLANRPHAGDDGVPPWPGSGESVETSLGAFRSFTDMNALETLTYGTERRASAV